MDTRLKTIVSNVLKLKADEVIPDVSRETCKAWTSLAHLLLVTQIESAYGVQLSTSQVVSIRTLGDLEKIVGEARVAPVHAPSPLAGEGGDGGKSLAFSRLAPKRLPAGVKPVALVTGSSRGIGAETARSLARRGYAVVVHFHSQEGAAKYVQESLVKDGADAIVVQADLANPASLGTLVDAVTKRWGRLDVLVNNAAPPIAPAPVESLSAAELQRQLDAHVLAPLRLSQAFFPLLKSSGSAVIINVLSVFIHGVPPEGLAAYVAAKSALAGLTRSMAREWAKHNIRVNAISPTITRTALSRGMDPAVLDDYTRRTPIGRLLEPQEVGEAIAHLATDPSEYMTGADIPLDGGMVMR